MPTVEPADAIVERAAALARAFRERELPVVRVRVAFSPDRGDVIRSLVDAPPSAITRAPDWADLREEIGTGRAVSSVMRSRSRVTPSLTP
jgi:nicotinamidase-related amidase